MQHLLTESHKIGNPCKPKTNNFHHDDAITTWMTFQIIAVCQEKKQKNEQEIGRKKNNNAFSIQIVCLATKNRTCRPRIIHQI